MFLLLMILIGTSKIDVFGWTCIDCFDKKSWLFGRIFDIDGSILVIFLTLFIFAKLLYFWNYASKICNYTIISTLFDENEHYYKHKIFNKIFMKRIEKIDNHAKSKINLRKTWYYYCCYFPNEYCGLWRKLNQVIYIGQSASILRDNLYIIIFINK